MLIYACSVQNSLHLAVVLIETKVKYHPHAIAQLLGYYLEPVAIFGNQDAVFY